MRLGCRVRELLQGKRRLREITSAPLSQAAETLNFLTLTICKRLRLMYLIYSGLYALALIVSLPYWVVGMARAGKYRAGLKERLGGVPSRLALPLGEEKSIWVHAVSVGEVLAVTGVVSFLKAEFPETPIFISTTTLTGQR